MISTRESATPSIARLQCGPAEPGDDASIRRLFRLPMPGRIAIATPHEPDHRSAMRQAGDPVHEVVVREAAQGSSVIGYGYRAVQNLMINGEARRVGYLGGLRCEASLRTAVKVLGRCFDYLSTTRCAGEAGYDLTSIMADNTVVRRGLEKGLSGLPKYVPVGRIVTLTLRTDRGRRYSIAPGTGIVDPHTAQSVYARYRGTYNGRPADHPGPDRQGNAANHGTTHLGFRVDGGVRGCITLWDQRDARQIEVCGYHSSIRRARLGINLGLTLVGRPTLPPAGSRLNMAYASHAGFDLDDAETAVGLVGAACRLASERNIRLLSTGLPAGAPVLQPLIKRFRPWVTESVIYAVTSSPEAIDLDQRPLWMEIATL